MAYKYLKYVALSVVLINENAIIVLDWKLLAITDTMQVGWTI
jgi:hypothetical protein